MEFVITNSTTESLDSEKRLVGNLDLVFILLVVFVVMVCLAVCCVVGRQKKKTHVDEQHDVLDEYVATEAPPLDNHHDHGEGSMLGVVDHGILRGSPCTPESPPPSYYVADRGHSFQSYISQTSSQFEVPPPYDETSKGRASLASTCIPEEGEGGRGKEGEDEGGSGFVVEGGEKVGKRKSMPLSSGVCEKEKKRRTKSDVVKGRKKKITSSASVGRSDVPIKDEHEREGSESLLEESEEMILGGASKVSMPTRFSKRDSKTARFTPV